jgi:hypothetical protein
VSRGLFLANVLVAGLGCLFAAGIVRDVIAHRSLPPAPAASASQPTADAADSSAAPPPIASYQIIATKNVFDPGRTEATEASAAAATVAGVRPILHGVVIDGRRSRAYLEQPPERRVLGYSVGDPIAGGRLEAIEPDRVVIARPQGRLEVMLQDSSKLPQVIPGAPAPPPPGPPPPARSSSGRVTTPLPPRPTQ